VIDAPERPQIYAADAYKTSLDGAGHIDYDLVLEKITAEELRLIFANQVKLGQHIMVLDRLIERYNALANENNAKVQGGLLGE
jgi:hypothetical protein